MEEEVWKEISGYEGLYMISSFGRVKSLEREVIRKNGTKQRIKDKIFNICLDNNGYCFVKLSKDNTRKHFKVHRLVGLAFIENPENKPEIDHIDRDKKNNHILNLRWTTKSENCFNRPSSLNKKKYWIIHAKTIERFRIIWGQNGGKKSKTFNTREEAEKWALENFV